MLAEFLVRISLSLLPEGERVVLSRLIAERPTFGATCVEKPLPPFDQCLAPSLLRCRSFCFSVSANYLSHGQRPCGLELLEVHFWSNRGCLEAGISPGVTQWRSLLDVTVDMSRD